MKCCVCDGEIPQGRKAKVCSKACATKRTREKAREYRKARRDRIIAQNLPKVADVIEKWAARKASKEQVHSAGSYHCVPRRIYEPLMLKAARA